MLARSVLSLKGRFPPAMPFVGLFFAGACTGLLYQGLLALIGG